MKENVIIEIADLEVTNAGDVKGGQPPHVKVFSAGGLESTANNNPTDIIVGSGPGGTPHVK